MYLKNHLAIVCKVSFIICFFLIQNPKTRAQCPDITASALNGAGCYNGSTPCDLCPGETFQLTVSGDNLPHNGCINWYYNTSSGFNPYNGEGTLIGCGTITAPPPAPCSTCPEILAIWIDACGTEQANEFMIISSGSGFNVSNFGLNYDMSNNGMSPLNDDVNANGGGCSWQVPAAGIISAMQSSANCDNSNIIPAGPGTNIPAGALVVIYTSSAASTQYNFDQLCANGHIIYVMQSSCARTIGAFSNFTSSGLRTTIIQLNNCNCSHSLTHDTDDPSLIGDGDYVYYDNGTVMYGNGGCANPTPPDVEPGPVVYPPSSVASVTFTATAVMCNNGPYYVVGIVSPLAVGCNEIFTSEFSFNVVCPEAIAYINGAPCSGNTITLEATGGDTYAWSGPGGFNSNNPNPTLGPLNAGFAGTYSVTVTNAAGCTDVAQVTLPVYSTPILNVTPDNPMFCEGQSVVLQATAQGGGGNYLFDWTSPNGMSSGQTITVGMGGAYQVTVTDANGCIDIVNGTIVQLDTPQISIQPNPAGFCAGGQVELGAIVIGGAGGNNYLWTDPVGNPFNTPVHTAQSPGQYNLIVTDNEGCSGAASILVTVNPVPQVNITASQQNICPGQSVTLSANGNGGTGSYSFAWITPIGNASGNPISADTAGIYSVILTDGAGCTATDTFTLINATPLVISFNPSPATFCPGGTVILNALVQGGQGGNLTYVWSTPMGIAYGNPLNTSIAGTYSLVVTEDNGCTGSGQVQVLQSSMLSISFPADTISVCNGGAITISGMASGGDGNYTYYWEFSGGPTNGDSLIVQTPGAYILHATDGSGCSGQDTMIVIPEPSIAIAIQSGVSGICVGGSTVLMLDPLPDPTWTVLWNTPLGVQTGHPITAQTGGIYTVAVNYGGGCQSVDTFTLQSFPNPVITIDPSNPSICPGSMITLAVTIASGGPLTSYAWNTPGGGSSNTTVTAALAGTYQLTVTNNQGCTASASTTVSFSAGLNVNFPSPVVTICAGATTGLTPTILSGISPISYQWTGPTGTAMTDTLFTAQAGTYHVTVTDASGCSGSATVSVQIGTNLSVEIDPNPAGFCTGTSVLLSANAPGGQSPLTYHWDTPAGSSAIPTIAASVSGLYFVTITDGSGCTGETSLFVQEWPAAAVTISPSNPSVCQGNTLTLDASNSGTSPGPFIYSWTGPNGTFMGGQYPNAGSGNYTVTMTDGNGCSAISQTTVQTLPGLQITIDPSVPVLCGTSSLQINAAVSGGQAPLVYTWIGPAGVLNGNPVMLNVAGNYNLVVVDAAGCNGTLNFTLNAGAGLSVQLLPGVTSACIGMSYPVTATVSGGSMPYTFNWQGPAGTATGNPANLTGPGTVSVTVTDQEGCTGTISTIISAKNIILTTLTTNETCQGAADGTVVIQSANGAVLPLTISIAGSAPQVAAQFPFSISGFTSGTYSLMVTDADGCQVLQSVNIGLQQSLEVLFQPDEVTILKGESILLNPQINFSAASFTWSPAEGLSCSNCERPTASPEATTIYTLTATAVSGCSAEGFVRVIVTGNTRVYIPTSFSPNNDGINDVFYIQAADANAIVSRLNIFDRWGNHVFSAEMLPVNDGNAGWNGEYRGSTLNPGVYVYTAEMIFSDGRIRLYRGEVTLMK